MGGNPSLIKMLIEKSDILVELAISASLAAGAAILETANKCAAVTTKYDGSPLTIADRMSHHRLFLLSNLDVYPRVVGTSEWDTAAA